MPIRILPPILSIAMLLFCACWSVAGPVHGAHGIVYGEFQLHAVTAPAPAEAGAPVRLELTISDPSGADVTELESGAGAEVFIVRKELDVFSRLQMPEGDGGAFFLDLKFPVAGTYLVYAAFTPRGGGPVTVMTEVLLEGDPGEPLPLEVHVPGRILSDAIGADVTIEKTLYGYKIGLGLIQPDGTPLTGVDASTGDMVIVSADGTEFFHANPAQGENATAAAFEASFPAPGLYKAWALFQSGGALLELPFAMDIRD